MSLNVKKISVDYVLESDLRLNAVILSPAKGRANDIRYLGIYIVSASTFKCSLDNAKRSFYRSFNAIFEKVGRIASNEVIVQLIKTKCFPVLYYGSRHTDTARTPTTLLKKIWTRESEDDEVKTAYQYVIDLRERVGYMQVSKGGVG